LDEPTNHLDLSYQKELLDLLKTSTIENRLTVVSIFHDLNLAGLYCDRLLLLEKGTIHIQHIPNEVLKEERIRSVFHAEIKKLPHPKVAAPQMVLLPNLERIKNTVKVDQDLLSFSEEFIELTSPIALRTMSSGVLGSGVGWYQKFVNRHVDKNYNCSDHRDEMSAFLKTKGFEPAETVGMMTAVFLEDAAYQLYEQDDLSIFVVVTAGVSNAVDASKSERHSFEILPGTINTWIFVNGELTEEAFIQSIMTATEVKGKVMNDQNVIDKVTGTIATGTSTDSILIAATQQGKCQEFAGTITPLGGLISKAVYECTTRAIQKSRKRRRQ
jgi:iron complex transport system ATP-binding protein